MTNKEISLQGFHYVITSLYILDFPLSLQPTETSKQFSSLSFINLSLLSTIFLKNLIQFHFSDFDTFFEMNWLRTYEAKIDSKDLKVILCNEKGQEVYFHGQREEKLRPLISAMKERKLLCQGCFRYWGYAIEIHNKEQKQRMHM